MEQRKDVPGFEGHYQASNLGYIRSIKFNKIKILKPVPTVAGYLIIDLYRGDTHIKIPVHRVILLTFSLQTKPEVNHINGIKTDNRVENLEWCTHSENIRHKDKVLGKRENHGNCKNGKITYQYDLQGNLIKVWKSGLEIKRSLGLDNALISLCCRGRIKKAHGFVWKN